MPGDRLSALPDELLLHILSSLDTSEVIRTSILSQRWRYLWTSIPGDRLSALPNGLLRHILSFLDTSEVIRTSILSRRWRYLWTSRLSALPDGLLLHILSSLDMTEVIRTSILSGRWRNLWTSTPALNFGYNPSLRTINNTLVLYNGSQIQKFQAHFVSSSPDVVRWIDSWIRFLVRRKVQELDLRLPHDNRYPVHSSLYTSRSIEVLKLGGFELRLPASVHLPKLRILELYGIDLSDTDISVLTSGCPLLEELSLVGCNLNTNLTARVPNPNLRRLLIREERELFMQQNRVVEIDAPGVLFLEICSCLRSCYRTGNMSSLVSVSINTDTDDCAHCFIRSDQFVGLLHSFSHAKTLNLGAWCVQVLSIKEVEGKQAPLCATHLELKSGFLKYDLLGMAFLLKSCLCLEHLVVHTGQENEFVNYPYYHTRYYDERRKMVEYVFDIRAFWESLEQFFSHHYSQLKTVKIYGFMGSIRFCQEEQEDTAGDEIIERRINELELIKFFLMSCNLLEEITIVTTEEGVTDSLRFNLAKRLLCFPKASPNVKIVFL